MAIIISTLISQWLHLISLLVLAIPLLFLLLLKQSKTQQPNHLPPGPPKLPIIGNLHHFGHLPHRSLSKLSNIYGLSCSYTRPRAFASSLLSRYRKRDLENTRPQLRTRPSLLTLKRLSYNFLDVALAPYNEYWREMRRIFVQELLSPKMVHSFGAVRAEEVANMVNSITKTCSSMWPVDLTEEIFSLINRVICRIAFGKSYQGRNFDGGKFSEFVHKFMALSGSVRFLIGSFSASDLFPSLSIVGVVDVITGLRGRLERCFRDLDKFYQEIIDEHLERAEQDEDIIDVLVGIMRDESSAIHNTLNHIKAILMDIFFGGLESSSLTTVWAMTELARKPELMKKAQEEIRTSVGKKGMVEEGDLEQLHYLKIVVKETLRLYTTAPLLIPRECMKHCKVNGYDISPKTRVMVNVWAIGRNPEYWDNPDMFFPERFEGSSIDYKGQHFELLPFGAGRRICPAMTMGILHVELALANLLYCFDWKLPSGMQIEDIDMEEGTGISLHKKSPLLLALDAYAHEVEKLKEQVRNIIKETELEPSSQLNLVDALQRLGVSYHFEMEIEEAMKQMFDHEMIQSFLRNNDLYGVALCFRLLRQQGYNISSGN
ncbi:hypothetical protein Sjap_011893 [Stephania japonica]|uniref:Terpene synthase N-terminal domain-containing protein n=1 Tax=Stephania japonica TaxID=461633 RepID=A0AAP0JC65_9MAGN